MRGFMYLCKDMGGFAHPYPNSNVSLAKTPLKLWFNQILTTFHTTWIDPVSHYDDVTNIFSLSWPLCENQLVIRVCVGSQIRGNIRVHLLLNFSINSRVVGVMRRPIVRVTSAWCTIFSRGPWQTIASRAFSLMRTYAFWHGLCMSCRLSGYIDERPSE